MRRAALALLGNDLSGWDRMFRAAAGAVAGAPSR